MHVRYLGPVLVISLAVATAACSGDSGGPQAPSNSGSSTQASNGSGGTGSGSTTGSGGGGTGSTSAGGTGSTGTSGSASTASLAGTGLSTDSTGATLAGTSAGLTGTTADLAGSSVSVVPQTLSTTGSLATTPLLAGGPLVATEGTGSGVQPLITTSTVTPNGTANTAAVNLPSPVLGNTQVLPGATSTGGPILSTNTGANTGSASTTSTSSSNGGLVNGVLGTVGVRRDLRVLRGWLVG